MSEKTTKTVFRFFLDLAHNKEQRWLEDMASRGWSLKGIFIGWYRFEKRPPAAVAYRADYRGSLKTDKKEYLGLFKDAGWEFVTTSAGWYYFRTPRGEGREPEIFSDPDSRLALNRRIIAGATVILAVLLIDLNSVLNPRMPHTGYTKYISLLLALMAGLIGYGLIRLLVQTKRLKRGPLGLPPGEPGAAGRGASGDGPAPVRKKGVPAPGGNR